MGLAEDIEALAPTKKTGCRVADILATYTPKDRATLETIIADKAWSRYRVAALFRRQGHPLGDSIVGVHRNGDCACGSR